MHKLSLMLNYAGTGNVHMMQMT